MRRGGVDLSSIKEEIVLPSGVIDFSDIAEDEGVTEEKVNKLTDKFLIPPLSIFDTTKDYWIKRKKEWKSLGLKSDEGRGDNMMKSLSALGAKCHNNKQSDESVFDPVLCEVIYTWFAPHKNGKVLDPFTGGSVRGVVASYKNLDYTGFDIRQEQIDANYAQIDLCEQNETKPNWITHDSSKMDEVLPSDYKCDLVFSCPPYADLEVYSDIEGDISNMKYDDFLKVYKEIIKKSCSYLNDDRFACFVVGEVRDKKTGYYYNFVKDTIDAFESAGLHFYDDIVLRNSVGTKCLTCSKGMNTSRKVGKIHQNVLVFVKGDARKATENVGEIEVLDITEEGQE